MVHSFLLSTILVSAVLQMTFGQKFVPKSTGERCISTSDCATLPDGSYQWCDSCTSYISCWYHTATIKPYVLESQPYWDDNEKKFMPQSNTCVEGYYPCPPGPSAPPEPTEPKCKSTGLGCLNSTSECPSVYSDNYQYCGSCTKYINCYHNGHNIYNCASGTFFDAIQRKCVAQSKTCVECYAPCSPPTQEPPSTTTTSLATCPPCQPCTTPPEKECTCGCSCSSKCE